MTLTSRTVAAVTCAVPFLLLAGASLAAPAPTEVASPFSGATREMVAPDLTPRIDPSAVPWLARSFSGSSLVRTTARALALGGLVAFVSQPYENPRRMARLLDNSFLEGPTDAGDIYGSGLTLGSGALGIMLLGRVTGNRSLEETGNDLCRSLIASGAVVWSVKLAAGRTRPNGGKYSFPSGHTAAAFSVAPILRKHYGLKVAIPAYALALSTGLGRMEDRKHYLSDVLFGAVIGLAIGESVAGRDDGNGFSGSVLVDPSRVGFSYRF